MHPDGTISIRVNGEHLRVRGGITLAELAAEMGIGHGSVVVERNFEIVPRNDIDSVKVEDGDELEISPSVG